MYLVFELLFYVGLAVTVIGLVWFLSRLLRGRFSGLAAPAALTLFGLLTLATPAILTRYVVNVDLGPRNVLVDGERHITLTGWDRDDYEVLLAFPETIVLQMANADVSDDTLVNLRGMANLRELDLNDTAVTDAGLKHLIGLSGLEVLRLRSTSVTDVGFDESLSKFPRLNRLDLRETAVSDAAIEQWKSAADGRRAFH